MPYLACVDCDKIQSFIFRTERLRFIRNASAHLQELDESMSGLCGGSFLCAAGGVVKASFDVEAQAVSFCACAKRQYRARGISVTVHVESYNVTESPSDVLRRSEAAIRSAKESSSGFESSVSAPPFQPCRLGGGLPASTLVTLPSGTVVETSPEMQAIGSPPKREFLDEIRSNLEGAPPWPETVEEVVGAVPGEAASERRMLAMVYADANRMGEWWGGYDGTLQDLNDVVRTVREAVIESLARAIGTVLNREIMHRMVGGGKLPALPLIVGGDDVVVLCPARYGLELASGMCSALESCTDTTAAQPTDKAEQLCLFRGFTRLTYGIGVAMFPAKFPIRLAFQVAHALQKSAKRLSARARKEASADLSAVDFALVTDAFALAGENLLRATTSNGHLYARPLLVGGGGRKAPDLTQLIQAMETAVAMNSHGKRTLTQGQVKEIRELMTGPEDIGKTRIQEMFSRSSEPAQYRSVLGQIGIPATSSPVLEDNEAWPFKDYDWLREEVGCQRLWSPIADVAELYALFANG